MAAANRLARWPQIDRRDSLGCVVAPLGPDADGVLFGIR
jgi:hypothetical protein